MENQENENRNAGQGLRENQDNLNLDKYKLKSNAVDDRLNISGAVNRDITDPIGVDDREDADHVRDIEDTKLTRDDD